MFVIESGKTELMRLPTVLLSRLALQQQTPGPTSPATPMPLMVRGTTYTMAQEATALDAEHFAVGRWDGSLQIYRFAPQTQAGPIISKAVNCPAQEGVQMIVALDPARFASSNDESSVALWSSPVPGEWQNLQLTDLLQYDPSWGVANSAAAARHDESDGWLLIGHANGFVSLWASDGFKWRLIRGVDVRATHPLNPWGLRNVRGIEIVACQKDSGIAVSGSEDGDLTLLEFPSGRIVSKTPYNPEAQRGINALAFRAGILLAANCAVGSTDKNLWAYSIDLTNGRIQLTDCVNLAVDIQAPQTFNFDVIWGGSINGAPAFLSSTEEGLLWLGTAAAGGKLSIIGHVPVSYAPGSKQVLHLGSGVCHHSGRVAVAAYDVAHLDVLDQQSTASS